MPVITVQLGQCGNQLGYSLFDTLAAELDHNDYGADGWETFFRPAAATSGPKDKACTARAVLIDMEPKVISAVRSQASRSSSMWSYAGCGYLCQQSGSGNNWAQGYHRYGASVQDAVLELLRKEAEACDWLEGFLLLQSMAGGTGAGLGTRTAEVLRDEFGLVPMANACVWPHESGEVLVQSYNTLLTLTHLSQVSDGIILLENEGLQRVCARLLGNSRPGLKEMNEVAAHALTGALLPSYSRPCAAPAGSGSAPLAPPMPRAARACTAKADAAAAAARGPPSRMMSCMLQHLCVHPMYRLLSVSCLPLVPPKARDFTTFTWPATIKRLRQMQLTGSTSDEGIDWSVGPSGPASSGPPRSSSSARGIKCVAAHLNLRGEHAFDADVSELLQPGLYAPWLEQPLQVSAHSNRMNGCPIHATLLSNSQSCMRPIRRMQRAASLMLAERAYLHQYERYGVGQPEMRDMLEGAQQLLEHYGAL